MGSTSVTLLSKTTMVEAGEERLPVHTLTFGLPSGMDSLGVRIDMGDVIKVVVPDYKPKSYSMSAERPGQFDITFKVYPNGRASGYLDRVPIGGTMEVFRKGKKERHAGRFVGIIGFGVGITEALPVAEAELSKPEASRVLLLWCLRTWAETFWHDRIAALKAEHGERFAVVIMLSRDEHEGCLHGRLDAKRLDGILSEWWGGVEGYFVRDARFLTVGTKAMMREAEAMLTEVGYPMPQQALLSK